MKNEKNMIRLIWAFALFPMLLTLAVFQKLPDTIPMHWNINGNIDAWYPKFPGAFLIPLLCIAISFMIAFLPKIDPKKENYPKFKSQYLIIRMLIVLILAIVQMIVISVSLGAVFLRVDTIVKFLIAVLFIVLGNIMPKLKHNYFVGIKTPWTIANEAVWTKSHRHAGFIWFIAGFIMIGLSFIPGTISAIAYFSLIGIISLEPVIYSWISFKRM